MKVLVVGANGATGRLVVDKLLSQGVEVNAIVRSLESLPENPNLLKIQSSVHELSSAEMEKHVKGCGAVVSCLGHNLTFKGMFGMPRLLVTDTIECICNAIKSNNADRPTKVILMNTTGNSNRDIPEKPPLSQRIVISILRVLLPPHLDNEKAADFLRTEIGQHDKTIEWVAVRPDALTDETAATEYDVYPSPVRNAIFDSGATSRINVGGFMAELILDESTWLKWKGHMPVIYNHAQKLICGPSDPQCYSVNNVSYLVRVYSMKMNYFVFGTNNKERAVTFYDELFDGCGLNKMPGQGRMTLWGNEEFMFAIAEPFDENRASNGNGTMLGLHVDSIEEVNRLHKKSIDLGGVSEGDPGIRSNMHSAYARDLDGNKICFYTSNA